MHIDIIVVLVVCYEQSSIANHVNVLNKNDPGRSRPKKSVDTEIYVALPPENIKTGKQDNPPTLIRLDPNSPNKFKGKFPTPIERFIQRIQNYFSVYNPPEYLNDLRPGINNPENDGYQLDSSNNTQVILPCNGTSTIVIIPVPLENENISTDQNSYSDKPEAYVVPTTPKPNCPEDVTTEKPNCPEVTTPKPNCPEVTTPRPKCPEITTPKPNCPEVTTPKPNCPEVTTQKPNCPEVTTQKPNCPEVTTPKPNCPEVTTQKPNCPEVTTPKPNCPEVTTPKPKCPEITTPKPHCPEVTTPKPKCPEATTPKPKCPEVTTQKPPYPPKQNSTASDPKPISGYGPTEVPSLNLIAQPVLGSTVLYFYKQPTTSPSYNPPAYNPPAYYIPNTQLPYEENTRRPKPPILRLKQLLFPRLYAAFHPDE
ncbi:extensin-like [Aphis craccivora]|uniref:Extensin-like n=1 Tax=Aphis craccivora TaxID=307492 RepID=A0A6G0Z0Q8_APHCR|nr:extensin-like [Aphis craccivora]